MSAAFPATAGCAPAGRSYAYHFHSAALDENALVDAEPDQVEGFFHGYGAASMHAWKVEI